MKFMAYFAFWLCTCQNALSQIALDYKLRRVLDGEHSVLERFQGKPIILEFFSSGCVVCFNEMPRINELSRKFEDRVTFVLVGDDSLKLPDIYQRFKERYDLKLNVIFSPALHKLFEPPHTPYFIWVNGQGTVVAESGGEIVTELMIESFLAGRENLLKSKAVTRKAVDRELFSGKGYEFYFRSGFSAKIDSVECLIPNSIKLSEPNPYLQFINCPIATFLKLAWFGQTEWFRTDPYYAEVWPSVEVADDVNRSELSQLVCYSLYSKGYKTQKTLQNILRQDLNRSFGLSASLIELDMPCWVIRRSDSNSVVIRSRHTSLHRNINARYDGYSSKFGTFSNFLGWIEYTSQVGIPIIDMTDIKWPVDIEFSAVMTDWNDVLMELRKSGFDVVKETRPMQVLKVYRNLK